jgi:hypothetical protein
MPCRTASCTDATPSSCAAPRTRQRCRGLCHRVGKCTCAPRPPPQTRRLAARLRSRARKRSAPCAPGSAAAKAQPCAALTGSTGDTSDVGATPNDSCCWRCAGCRRGGGFCSGWSPHWSVERPYKLDLSTRCEACVAAAFQKREGFPDIAMSIDRAGATPQAPRAPVDARATGRSVALQQAPAANAAQLVRAHAHGRVPACAARSRAPAPAAAA